MNGNVKSTEQFPVKDLTQGKSTWFFQDPLSSIVRVTSTGKITVEGMTSEWFGGIVPQGAGGPYSPVIDSGVWEIDLY